MMRGLKWAMETCSLSGHLHGEAVDLATVIANPSLCWDRDLLRDCPSGSFPIAKVGSN